MPQIHIAGSMGRPLDCSDEFGSDFDITSLNGKTARITHATRDQIVFEIQDDSRCKSFLISLGKGCVLPAQHSGMCKFGL